MKKRLMLVLAIAMMTIVLATSAFATVSMNYNVEDATTDTGVAVKKIVLTMTDDESDWRALQTKINFNYDKIIPIDWYDGTVPDYTNKTAGAEYPFKFNSFQSGRSATAELGRPQVPVWTIDGANSQVIVELYWGYLDTYPITATDTMIYELYFKYADGVTADDLVASDFELTYVHYTDKGEYHFYGHEDDSLNDIILTNNVVPAAAVITVPVTAGDIVYLQDGTFATAAETGDYVVLNDVGYVAVNTGKTSQKTYYIDGTTATAVHTNGVIGSDDLSLRSPDETWEGEDRSGLRFKMGHNPGTRTVENHNVTEVGFIMTAETSKVMEAIGATEYVLNMDMVTAGTALKGVAYGYDASGYCNKAYDQSNDDLWIISGVFYGVPLTTANVQTKIVSRPYYMIGDSVVYGELTSSTLYDTAKAIKASDNWANLSEGQQSYVNEIIGLVETTIVEDEVIIDISDLYVGI